LRALLLLDIPASKECEPRHRVHALAPSVLACRASIAITGQQRVGGGRSVAPSNAFRKLSHRRDARACASARPAPNASQIDRSESERGTLAAHEHEATGDEARWLEHPQGPPRCVNALPGAHSTTLPNGDKSGSAS